MRPTNLLPDRLRRYLLALAEIGHETHRDLKLALLARRRSVFLDVGANRGQFARFMASFYDRVVVSNRSSGSRPSSRRCSPRIARGAGASHSEVAVQVRRLDDFAFGVVDFIKVDIEGAEFAFLPGAVATLRRCRPVLLIEIEDRHSEGRRGASSMCSPASATGPSLPLPNPTAADRLPSAAC